jgi:hypothetical protein
VTTRRRLGGVLLAAALLSSCGGGSESGDILDGRPRFPDDEGVVTEISTASITLDGSRTYQVSDRLAAFSTYTRQLEPMLGRDGQYVQIGVDGDTMIWMAGIGSVVALDPPSAFYIGALDEIVERDGDRHAVFVDGTALRLAQGVDADEGTGRLQARIDVSRHEVVELRSTLGEGGER